MCAVGRMRRHQLTHIPSLVEVGVFCKLLNRHICRIRCRVGQQQQQQQILLKIGNITNYITFPPANSL